MTKEMVEEKFPTLILDLVKRVERLLLCQASNPHRRILIALAGVPGSGKSTVSDSVVAELSSRGIQDVAIVPMDGFHYTKEALSQFENPDLAFQRRGAPFTFNAKAFVDLVIKLSTTPVTAPSEPEDVILVPSFDHAAKDPVENAIFISTRNRLVIVEGNYTLLNQEPWKDISTHYAERWFVDAPVNVVRDRLAKRHLAAGIEDSIEAGIERAEMNDIPNGALIRAQLIKPDVIIQN